MTTVPTSSLPITAIPVERFVERLYAPLAWEATVRLGDAALASRLVERVLHRAWDERERFATFDALNRHVQDAAMAAVATEAERRRNLTRFDHAAPDAPAPGGLESMSVEAVQRRIAEHRAPSPTPPQVVAVIQPAPAPTPILAPTPAPIAAAPIPTPTPTPRAAHTPRLSMSGNRVGDARPSVGARPSARNSAAIRSPVHTAESKKAAMMFGGAAERFSEGFTTVQKQVGAAVALAIVVITAISLRSSTSGNPEARAFAALSDTAGVSYDAAQGAIKDLALPDSSKARLGSGSSLVANTDFGDGARALRIVGPVELALKNDSSALVAIQAGEHRFVTAGAVVSFSRNAAGLVAVQVDSGAIVLVRDSSRVRLVAGSMVRVDTGTPASLTREERDEAFGWRKGRMQLSGRPLSAIAAATKTWYGVDLQFPAGRAASDTASLDVPLAERDSLVASLERALRATASVSGNRIVLQAAAGAGPERRRGLAAPREVLPPPSFALPKLPPLE